jgi:hypothetical protein
MARWAAKRGGLSFYLGSSKDEGKWWVKGGRLCQKWKRWLDAAENCIRLKQDGEKLVWRRDDGMTGTATLMPDTRSRKELLPAYALGGPVPENDADETGEAPAIEPKSQKYAMLEAAPAPVAPKLISNSRTAPSTWSRDLTRFSAKRFASAGLRHLQTGNQFRLVSRRNTNERQRPRSNSAIKRILRSDRH